MNEPAAPLGGAGLTEAISVAIVEHCTRADRHERTSADTYINDDVVVCSLQSVLSTDEAQRVAAGLGSGSGVIGERVAVQTATQDEFTAAIERLTQRPVLAFVSVRQTTPGVASELIRLQPKTEAGA